MSCALAHRSRCDGHLEHHHVISKQRIRNALGRGSVVAESAVADERNLLPLCRTHHHLVTVGALHLREAELPGEVFAFATDYGLVWSLERDLRYWESEKR